MSKSCKILHFSYNIIYHTNYIIFYALLLNSLLIITFIEKMKEKLAEEVLYDFIGQELGDILDCVESRYDEDHFWEMYVTQRIDEMMFRYGDIKVCGFYPDQERLRSIIGVKDALQHEIEQTGHCTAPSTYSSTL